MAARGNHGSFLALFRDHELLNHLLGFLDGKELLKLGLVNFGAFRLPPLPVLRISYM